MMETSAAHAHGSRNQETASLVGYDWVEEGGVAAAQDEPAEALDSKLLSKATSKDWLSGQVFLQTLKGSPVEVVCALVATVLCLRVYIETISAMTTRGCGWFSVLDGGILLFTCAPLTGLMLGKLYTYKTAQHYRVAETATHLSRQRQLINMNLGSFGFWAMVPWFVTAYSLYMGSNDSPIEPYVCMHHISTSPTAGVHANSAFLGSTGVLGLPLWTCYCLLVGVPLTWCTTIRVRDAKEDAAEAEARRAQGGG
eukprot:TRINITY_DN1602_c0_g1_i1.p1 TRINITY_DN1602_c0_g1~~TRINITY_DN1602_c0_g1_i1.p1  ORF type:complete len:254 (+),score=58.70 TRINITY_DN1602_c0_g1_i1:178-939(+)